MKKVKLSRLVKMYNGVAIVKRYGSTVPQKLNIRGWVLSSSGRAVALQVQDPEFNFQHPPKEKGKH